MSSLAATDFSEARAASPTALLRHGAAISWPLSLAVVLAGHLAAAWWLLATHSLPLPAPQPLPAIMLDMMPAPTPPPAAAPLKQPARPAPDYQPVPHPPTPQVQVPRIEEARPLPTVAADLALPQQARPAPKPAKPKKVEKALSPTPAPPTPAAPKPVPAAASPAPSADMQAHQQAAQQQKEAALAAATLAAKSNWLGEVVQHIAKFRRTPRNRLRIPLRTVIGFSIDRDGKLLSQHLLQGSGRDEIDEEALAWIKRADPLPKPPADISDADLAHGFTIPVDFMPR